jgi:restriction system protein
MLQSSLYLVDIVLIMPIPDYETMMLPILKFLCDGKEHSLGEVLEHVYKEFSVTEKEKKELLPSGTDLLARNRMRWARLYLERAGLLESTKRGFYKITERGFKALEEKPNRIDNKYLMQFSEFQKFKAPNKETKTPLVQQKNAEPLNPTEQLEHAYQSIRAEIAEDLLEEVKKASPRFFESVVVELLVRMGYGGSRKDAGQAIGQSGDGGVDGIIKEDKLGLDAVYIQAKRWDKATVGRPDIQGFVGALKGQGANKGIFITTSAFTSDAKTYAAKIDSPKIVLIDGARLAELMFEHDVGVTKEETYEVKKIDHDYFSEG